MVVKMMKWRPWPPMTGKKFHVNMVVQSLQGLSMDDKEKAGEEVEEGKNENVKAKLTVEIKWKGGKGKLSSPFKRRSIKTNCTGEQYIGDNGVVEWNEEFDNICLLTMLKDSAFHPWDVTFSIISGLSQDSKNKPSVIGTAFLNLGEYASPVENTTNRITKIPVTCCTGGMAPEAALSVALNFVELRTVPEAIDPVDRISVPSTSSDGGSVSSEKEELSALKAGLRKVKILRGYVGGGRAKKACREEDGSDGRISSRSEEYEYADVFDTDSGNECDADEVEDKDSSSFRKSFSYGTLAAVNRVEGIYFGQDENDDSWVRIHKTQVESISRTIEEPCSSDSDHAVVQPSMRSLLSWKKRKLSFRSPRARGEPLLNKAYGEEGGDDIDFDRRQLCSPVEPLPLMWSKSEDGAARCGDFGDDHFAIGSWEQRDLVSRDGQMKLSAQVFFATIDQRSERAAGESACTALVAVIADWLHNNTHSMPIKSQFDTLIREGSLEWRNLCEIESYRERFPDRHFDLDTVLEAKIRSLSVAAEKSFVGFFQPEGLGDSFDFLQEAMSFDNIWEEIKKGDAMLAANLEPQIYIVSWNDHFFVLKVEKEAYYIIDTLGERLFEGCNQAYILKFDKDTTVYQLPEEQKLEEEKSSKTQSAPAEISKSAPAEISKSLPTENGNQMQQGGAKVEDASPGEIVESKVVEETLICKGKESCKEFIKGFWAAVPLRELEIDIKKGLLGRVPLHHRLQIEFHFTAHSCSTSMDLTVG